MASPETDPLAAPPHTLTQPVLLLRGIVRRDLIFTRFIVTVSVSQPPFLARIGTFRQLLVHLSERRLKHTQHNTTR